MTPTPLDLGLKWASSQPITFSGQVTSYASSNFAQVCAHDPGVNTDFIRQSSQLPIILNTVANMMCLKLAIASKIP
jgi:hypothetical protein